MVNKKVILVGYSGHAFVVCDILQSNNFEIKGYFDVNEKAFNPYQLMYLGQETEAISVEKLKKSAYFVAVGDNYLRRKITETIINKTNNQPINAVHTKAYLASTATIGHGVMLSNGSIINPTANLGNGVICNTNSVIEHDCQIGAFSHIAPGAIICGNVTIGKNTFIGAGSVVKQGITIGDNVIVGAGTVVIRNIADSTKVVGNPQKKI